MGSLEPGEISGSSNSEGPLIIGELLLRAQGSQLGRRREGDGLPWSRRWDGVCGRGAFVLRPGRELWKWALRGDQNLMRTGRGFPIIPQAGRWLFLAYGG